MRILMTGSTGAFGQYLVRESMTAGHFITDFSLAPHVVEGVRFSAVDIFGAAPSRAISAT